MTDIYPRKRFAVDLRWRSKSRSGKTIELFDTYEEAMFCALQQSLLPDCYYAIHDLVAQKDVFTTDELGGRTTDTETNEAIELIAQLSYQAFNVKAPDLPWLPSLLARASKFIQEQQEALSAAQAEREAFEKRIRDGLVELGVYIEGETEDGA